MHQIAPKLWVGSQADFEQLDQFGTEWAVVFAARDPWHRKELGYTGRGAPPDHPEYLFARRGNRLMLNLVDAQDPKYISRPVINQALNFIDERLMECRQPNNPTGVLVHCNQGQSRAPTIGLLYLAPGLGDFGVAEEAYRALCPSYAPGLGMHEFAHANWAYYQARSWAPGGYTMLSPGKSLVDIMTVPIGVYEPPGSALDRAERIWQAFCESMKTDPSRARDQLIQSIVQALSAAETQERLPHGRQESSSSSDTD